jgi:ribonuclease D
MLWTFPQKNNVDERFEKKLQCSVTIGKCGNGIISRSTSQPKSCLRTCMSEFEFVELCEESTQLAAISDADVVGVDTEFMREKTFFAQLCLVQVATPDQIFCVDPLLDEDLSVAWRVLMARPWVLHSGRQDMEVLYHATRRFPASVFDTQIAAGLLGHAPQIGYANLVAELFDVRLEKSHTRSDWSKRPLPHSALEYAAEDVAYLLPAQNRLAEALDKLNRLEWAEQDSASLLDESLYQNSPERAIDRVKGARNLRGVARAAAAGLASWRELEAVRRDRPRQWILRDPVLLEIASAQPATQDELAGLAGLSEKTARRAGVELLEIVSGAKNDIGDYQPPPRPDERQKTILKKAQAIVASCAAELGISTELLAPKKELSNALFSEKKSRVFRGWRGELVGDELHALFGNAQ